MTLKHLANNCRGNARPDCPIIDELATNVGVEASPSSNRHHFDATGNRFEHTRSVVSAKVKLSSHGARER
nr:hypothetical protein [Paracoccus sp. TRP]